MVVNVDYGDNYELLFYSNIVYTFNIISIIWRTQLWMKEFVTKQLEKALSDIENLKDKVRANRNGSH